MSRVKTPRQWLCGRMTRGHVFTVQVIHVPDLGTFVVDPCVVCDLCQHPLGDSYYAMIVENMNEELA
jgi:hypothetical protein